MAQGELTPEGLIEIAPGLLPEGTQALGSNVIEEFTCRLLVWIKTDTPPSFYVAPGKRTALARELGYWLVRAMEGARQAVPRRFVVRQEAEESKRQQAYRSIRKSLAERLLMPECRIDDPNVTRHWDVGPYGFEVSRRVFKFRNEGAGGNELICHVFAQVKEETTERLLLEFVRSVGGGFEPLSVHCDIDSDLCLWSRTSAQLGTKTYREIVIAPWSTLPKADFLSDDKNADSAHRASAHRFGDGMAAQRRKEFLESAAESAAGGTENVYAAFDDAVYARVGSDWEFVAVQVRDACAAGRPLDDHFIEGLATRRLELAKGYEYSGRRGAGATFESSLGIVRTIVDLHRAALDQDGAEAAGDPSQP